MPGDRQPPIRRLGRLLMGEPPPPVWMRIVMIIPIPVGAFVCAYFHLCHIPGFQIGAFVYLALFFAWKRLWWNPRQKAAASAGGERGTPH